MIIIHCFPISVQSVQIVDSQFQLVPEALESLKSETRPVTVVTIAGQYRTGKSYLLNRLLGRSDIFSLGSTSDAVTKGFWMWKGDFPGDNNR
jgi:hypothetical protein